jgi:ubiquitin-protein ligase
MTEIIDSNILLTLNQLPNVVRRRLTAELKTIIPMYTHVYLEIDNNLESPVLVIQDNNITQHYNIFTFTIPPEYPFKPPIVKLNSDNYINLLKFNNREELEMLKKLTNKDCLCCNSCLHREQWGPAITINFMINEIKENLIIVENIKKICSNNNQQIVNDDEKNLTKQV